MRQRMVIENLSPRTITSYLNGPRRLIEYCNKPPHQITTDEIYAFLVYEKEIKKHSRSTMRINVNGIRYLYKNFLNRPEIVEEVPYPKQEKYIPEIFTGKKDRFVQLSEHMLKELEGYYQSYKPETWMFNGRKKGSQISEAAMRWALLQALKREGITKKLHLHSLRHSFASHHVSMGTNLLHIQQLLGHESIQTTMLYLHLSDKISGNQKNPLDVMYNEG